MKETTRKAKRKLTDINFESETSHIALVAESQGGPANGSANAIILKGNRSEEFIKKASEVTVTLEITEYLRRFYGLWYDDAEVLARALGFTTAEMDYEAEEAIEEAAAKASGLDKPDYEDEYKMWMADKLASIQIMKSLYEAENKLEKLSEISDDDYLAILMDQVEVEKAFVEIEKGNKPKTDKEVTMPEIKEEVITKSQFEAIQKAFDDQKVELEKALASVAKFEAEKKEMITKSRKEKLLAAVKNDDRCEILFKAVGLVEDEAEFETVVKALADMQAVIEKSTLFEEKGAEVEDQQVESKVAQLLKARLTK